MTSIIAVVASKGGVGKTTVNFHLSHFYAHMGLNKKVLVIDMDSQANISGAFHDVDNPYDYDEFLMTHNLFENLDAPKKPYKTKYGIDLIRACFFELEQIAKKDVNEVVSNALKNLSSIVEDYDIIIIDTPPTFDNRTIAAIAIADYIYTPLSPDKFSIEGFPNTLNTINRIRHSFNPDVKYLGVLLNMVDTRAPKSVRNKDEFKEAYGDLIFDDFISRRFSLSDAAAEGIPIWKVRSGAARAAANDIDKALIEIHQRIKNGVNHV